MTVLSTSSLFAQQTLPGQSPSNSTQPEKRQSDARQDVADAFGQKSTPESSLAKNDAFAKCLAITNQEQVTLARFAKEKASSEEVKAFAATLESAHQSCLNELKGITTKAEATNKNARLTNSSNSTSNPSSIDFLQIHQEISEQCLKDGKEMLSEKQGVEFDQCFVGMQVAKHALMHSSLTVLQRHTSGELQSFVKDSLAKNDEHLQASISLMEQISDKAPSK